MHVLVDGTTIIFVICVSVVMKESLDWSNQPRSDVETEHMDRVSSRIHSRMLWKYVCNNNDHSSSISRY